MNAYPVCHWDIQLLTVPRFFFFFWLRAVSKFPSTWKDGLSIKELTKFIGDGSKKLQNFTEVCVGEGKSLPTTIQKSVKFLDFA